MLGEIEKSSDVCRASLSEMCHRHEQRAATTSTVTDQDGKPLSVSRRSWSSDIITYETGNSIEPPLPPSWNCIWRHYYDAGGPIWTKFGNLIQNTIARKFSDPVLVSHAYVGPCGCRYQKKTQKTRPEDSSTVVKNFTTIGCIAPAEISVPGQKKETAKSAKYGLNLIQEPNNTAEMPNGGQWYLRKAATLAKSSFF